MRPSRHKPRRWLGMVAGLLVASSAGWARAHDEVVSVSEVAIAGADVTWTVEVPAHGSLDAAAVATRVREGLTLVADGETLVAQAEPPVPRSEPGPDGRPRLGRVSQRVSYHARTPIGAVRLSLRFLGPPLHHRAVIRVDWHGLSRQYVRPVPCTLELSPATLAPSAWGLAREFVPWGVHHIFAGYDHVAFLLALILAVTSLRGLLGIVTAFTVAHSLTLMLAARGWVSVPPALTEILVAASIVYVATENLTFGARTLRLRWALTFAFGLVHGLGFATELRERLSEMSGSVAWPVVAFNLGVELGQLAIVALVFPIFRALRHGATERQAERRGRRLMIVGSLPLLALGLALLVARLAGV